jgi:hypothetical protein
MSMTVGAGQASPTGILQLIRSCCARIGGVLETIFAVIACALIFLFLRIVLLLASVIARPLELVGVAQTVRARPS